MSEAPQDAKVRFKYVFEDNYNPRYTNGAYGGVAPNGEIVVHCYHERHGLPFSETHTLNAKTGLGEKIGQEPPDLGFVVVRYIQAGLILNSATARLLRDWLDQQIPAAEAIERQRLSSPPPVEATGE